jgi:glucose/arabinose dehydrogenase
LSRLVAGSPPVLAAAGTAFAIVTLVASCQDAGAPPDASATWRKLCATPGSIVFTEGGKYVVPGGDPGAPTLDWLALPVGFCAHHFAHVPVARSIRFAPGGELFVASPSRATFGGGQNGLGAIVAIPDDDQNGVGDRPIVYNAAIASAHGMLFVEGWFYYQDDTKISRVRYRPGDRTPSGQPELVANIAAHASYDHWAKTLDVSDDGTIYVSNGGDQVEPCREPYPFEGGVLALDGTPGGRQVVRGLRNPMHLRCQRGHNRCFAAELARDSSEAAGGREKLIPIRSGDDWGHPCCATKGVAFADDAPPLPDCDYVAAESNAFLIGNTPFGFDFAPTSWPSPWSGAILLTLHGDYSDWGGAKVVAIFTDASGRPLPSSTLEGGLSGGIASFATGWDDGSQKHGRPGDAAFAPDGRLFVADDYEGEIFWVAPDR